MNIFSWCLAVAWLTLGLHTASAQIAVGEARNGDASVHCMVTATGAWDQSAQQVQIRIERTGEVATITLQTGRQKTVGQVIELLAGVTTRFTKGAAKPGAVLGKLGHIKGGGEAAFIAESPQVLRIDFTSADGSLRSSRLSADEASVLNEILARR